MEFAYIVLNSEESIRSVLIIHCFICNPPPQFLAHKARVNHSAPHGAAEDGTALYLVPRPALWMLVLVLYPRAA